MNLYGKQQPRVGAYRRTISLDLFRDDCPASSSTQAGYFSIVNQQVVIDLLGNIRWHRVDE
jgi:hypothetical protein